MSVAGASLREGSVRQKALGVRAAARGASNFYPRLEKMAPKRKAEEISDVTGAGAAPNASDVVIEYWCAPSLSPLSSFSY
jgi:hypothetical protein